VYVKEVFQPGFEVDFFTPLVVGQNGEVTPSRCSSILSGQQCSIGVDERGFFQAIFTSKTKIGGVFGCAELKLTPDLKSGFAIA
jgi:hypothetical protein